MERILIIEDNYLMRLFLVNYLDKSFWVDAVETPAEAIEKLNKDTEYALVLSDIVPEKSASNNDFKALIQMLKSAKANFMLLTDNDKSEERIKALQLGAKDTLSKPFNPVELELRINAIIEKSGNNPFKKVA